MEFKENKISVCIILFLILFRIFIFCNEATDRQNNFNYQEYLVEKDIPDNWLKQQDDIKKTEKHKEIKSLYIIPFKNIGLDEDYYKAAMFLLIEELKENENFKLIISTLDKDNLSGKEDYLQDADENKADLILRGSFTKLDQSIVVHFSVLDTDTGENIKKDKIFVESHRDLVSAFKIISTSIHTGEKVDKIISKGNYGIQLKFGIQPQNPHFATTDDRKTSHTIEPGFDLSLEFLTRLDENCDFGVGISAQTRRRPVDFEEGSFYYVPIYLILKIYLNPEIMRNIYLFANLGWNRYEASKKFSSRLFSDISYKYLISTSERDGYYFSIGLGFQKNNFIVELSYFENQGEIDAFHSLYMASKAHTKINVKYAGCSINFGVNFDLF